MKPPLLILLAVLCLYGCKKGASGPAEPSTALRSIVVYNPTDPDNRTLNIQSFIYGGDGRLLSYTDKAIDSLVSNGAAGVSYETRIFTFNYSGNGDVPDSYSLTDSNYAFVGNNLTILHERAGFVYDAQKRLTADTFDIPNSISSRYAYSGDTILYMQMLPGNPQPTGAVPLLVTRNGNVVNTFSTAYTYSSLPNPLQNAVVARTYEPIFYGGLIGLAPSYGLPVDFISKNLLSSLQDNQGNLAQFNWTVDSRGRVAAGMATNLYPYDIGMNGTIYITFNYE